MYRRNVGGQFVGFTAIAAANGNTMTGTTAFVAYRVLDGGAQATATGTVSDKGHGQYSFAMSAADSDGNNVSLLFTMPGMVAVEKTIVTTACDPTAAADFGITALGDVESGVSFHMAMQAIGAYAGGDVVESADHTTTTIAALGNPSTPRLTSINAATIRTVTRH